MVKKNYDIILTQIPEKVFYNNFISRWCRRILSEFFAQGDRERKLDLPISPLCDRFSSRVAKSQIGNILVKTLDKSKQILDNTVYSSCPHFHYFTN